MPTARREPPSGRPAPAGGRGTKGDRTRRRLLDAAAAEVARHGAGGASVAAIARAAELKPGSLYFHFASKDLLVEAMLEEGIRESVRRLEAEVPPAGEAAPEVRLRAAIDAHARMVAELTDYATVVLAPQFAGLRDATPAFRARRREYLRRWTTLVADAQAAGALGGGPEGPAPRDVRDLLLGALNAVGLAAVPPARAAAALAAVLGLGGDVPAGGRGGRRP